MTRLTLIEPGLSRLSQNADGTGPCLEGEPTSLASLLLRRPTIVGRFAGFQFYRDPIDDREIIAARGWCAVRTGHETFDACCDDLGEQLAVKAVA